MGKDYIILEYDPEDHDKHCIKPPVLHLVRSVDELLRFIDRAKKENIPIVIHGLTDLILDWS